MILKRNIIILGLLLLVCSMFCSDEKKQKIPLEQLNIDKSNNYKYIFKDVIEEERRKESEEKKDPFKD